MKLSVTKKGSETKLTDLSARKCATIKQVLISKFAFGREKLSGLSRNGLQFRACCTKYRLNILQERNKKGSKTH